VMLQSISSPRREAASPPSPRCSYSKRSSYTLYLDVTRCDSQFKTVSQDCLLPYILKGRRFAWEHGLGCDEVRWKGVMRLDFNSLGKCREPRVMRDIAVDLDTGSNAFTASGYQARVDLQGVPEAIQR
jgi:hypothetical protein